MRFWYDFEFTEKGPKHPLVPLSLGIVSEDNREYYVQFLMGLAAASTHPWLREHVISQLEHLTVNETKTYTFCLELQTTLDFPPYVANVPGCPWRSDVGQITQDITAFLGPEPEMWGYYADYDHVLWSQLWGRMIDLPDDFPMYTLDIIQEVKLKEARTRQKILLPTQGEGEHHALKDARWNKVAWEFLFPHGFPSLRGVR